MIFIRRFRPKDVQRGRQNGDAADDQCTDHRPTALAGDGWESNPAFLDFRLVFTSTDEPIEYENAMRQYRLEGFKAMAQLEATVRVPSIDFTFKTDPLESSKCDFAVMGDEANGA